MVLGVVGGCGWLLGFGVSGVSVSFVSGCVGGFGVCFGIDGVGCCWMLLDGVGWWSGWWVLVGVDGVLQGAGWSLVLGSSFYCLVCTYVARATLQYRYVIVGLTSSS